MGEWSILPFTDAVSVNPRVVLQRGEVYPFVEMAAVDSNRRGVCESERREFTGGGARFTPGDTLMARITPCLENGKIAKFSPTGDVTVGFGSTEFIVIRGRQSVTIDGYAYYLTKWSDFRQYAIGQMTGSSGRQRVPPNSLSGFEVAVPPIPIQRRIVDVLGSLDDKIELNLRMNWTLEKMVAAIFKSWFIDFDPVRAKSEGRESSLPSEIAALFPDSFEESSLGLIPRGWKVSQLSTLIELAYGKSLRAQDRRLGTVAVYGSNGQVGWHDTALVVGPGIVVGRKGNPGVVTWVPTEFFPIDTTFYVIPIGPIRSLYFLFHALENHNLASLGADSAVPGLNRNMAYMSQQIVPPAELIRVFDSFLKPIYDRIYTSERQNRRLIGLRDTLLPKLMSGEIELEDRHA